MCSLSRCSYTLMLLGTVIGCVGLKHEKQVCGANSVFVVWVEALCMYCQAFPSNGRH